MKFETGKLYKTRDGRKARVICVDRKDPFKDYGVESPIVALVETVGEESPLIFDSSGRYSPHFESDSDLIAEWKESLKVSGKVKWLKCCDVVPCSNDGEIPFKSLVGKKGTMTFVEDVE